MVTVLGEDEDLTGYEVKRCTASGAIHGSRMVEVIRGDKKTGGAGGRLPSEASGEA